MNKHQIDIIFLLIIIACLLCAFIGTFMSYNKVVGDNIFLAEQYFLHEKELVDICKIDYVEYMSAQRNNYTNELNEMFGGQDYKDNPKVIDLNLVFD